MLEIYLNIVEILFRGGHLWKLHFRCLKEKHKTDIHPNILHRVPPPALPEFTSVKSLSDHFSRYFADKIETIRSKFPDKVQNIPQVQKTEIRSEINVFERAMKLKSLFWAYRQNHVIWAPFLQACWKIVLTY